jgi:acyl carrier protein
MNRQQVENIVLDVLAAILKCQVSGETSRENTPQWDSLKHIEIMFSVEDEFGLQFSEAELAEMDSVDRIVERAMKKNEA